MIFCHVPLSHFLLHFTRLEIASRSICSVEHSSMPRILPKVGERSAIRGLGFVKKISGGGGRLSGGVKRFGLGRKRGTQGEVFLPAAFVG